MTRCELAGLPVTMDGSLVPDNQISEALPGLL